MLGCFSEERGLQVLGCKGQPANPSTSDPSLENISEISESAFLPWLQLSSQPHRLGLVRPRVSTGVCGNGSWSVERGAADPGPNLVGHVTLVLALVGVNSPVLSHLLPCFHTRAQKVST